MWIDNPAELFSVDVVPGVDDTASELCNKFTRILLIIIVILWYYAYPVNQIGKILLVGFIGIFIIYLFSNKKESFSPLSYKMDDLPPHSTPIPVLTAEVSTYPMHPYPTQEQVQQPIQYTQQPVQYTQQPVQYTQQPVQYTQQPVQYTQQPVQQPVQYTQQQPVQYTQQPTVEIPVRREGFSTSLALLQMDDTTPQHQPRMNQHGMVRGYQPENMRQPKPDSDYYTPNVGVNTQMYKEPIKIAPRIMDPQFSDVETNFPVNQNPVRDFGGMAMPEYERRRPVRHGLLFDRHNTEGELSESQMRPQRMFMQDVEPNIFSYSNERTPINANLGISSTPQLPPRHKQVIRGDNGRDYPLYSRIDPQLVRDDVPMERRLELPSRTPWSEELPGAAPNNAVYSVYDPRFTGYGDANRSYYDVGLGQVKYYYSDVDAYRSPNFVIRNKVDHVDFIDPMSKTYSMYPRTASLEDVNGTVHDDWLARSTEFREDIMEKLMRKNNSESWQLRAKPHSKGARLSTFTSGY